MTAGAAALCHVGMSRVTALGSHGGVTGAGNFKKTDVLSLKNGHMLARGTPVGGR